MNQKPRVALFGDIVEGNGKTIRENNSDRPHEFELGEIVEVDVDHDWPGSVEGDGILVKLSGRCRLYVVGHMRDCDGTPIYMLSDLPVRFPMESAAFAIERLTYKYLAHTLESGYSGDALTKTGSTRALYPTLRQYIDSEG